MVKIFHHLSPTCLELGTSSPTSSVFVVKLNIHVYEIKRMLLTELKGYLWIYSKEGGIVTCEQNRVNSSVLSGFRDDDIYPDKRGRWGEELDGTLVTRSHLSARAGCFRFLFKLPSAWSDLDAMKLCNSLNDASRAIFTDLRRRDVQRTRPERDISGWWREREKRNYFLR